MRPTSGAVDTLIMCTSHDSRYLFQILMPPSELEGSFFMQAVSLLSAANYLSELGRCRLDIKLARFRPLSV